MHKLIDEHCGIGDRGYSQPQPSDRTNLIGKSGHAVPTARLIISAALLSLAPVAILLTADPADASATLCTRAHKACISDCKTAAPFEFRKACYDRCAIDFKYCVGAVVTPAPEPFHFWRWKHHKHRHDDPKDPPKPPKPPKPPHTDNHTPPTGGGVVQPKTPGRISDPVLGTHHAPAQTPGGGNRPNANSSGRP